MEGDAVPANRRLPYSKVVLSPFGAPLPGRWQNGFVDLPGACCRAAAAALLFLPDMPSEDVDMTVREESDEERAAACPANRRLLYSKVVL